MLKYKRNKNDQWTPDMYEKLTALYSHHTNKELEELTGWTTKEMQYRAGILGVTKTKETERRGLTKIEFIADHEAFIRENFDKMSNKELAEALGWKIQFIRPKCYALGLYRFRLEFWTDEQIQFLKENYRQIGDKELSQIFQSKWKKNKAWTLKHIEKKRLYLKLKRTKEEINAIRDRNVESGIWSRGKGNVHWLTYGISKEGEIRMALGGNGRWFPMIKVGGNWISWALYTWEQAHGTVTDGRKVVFKNDDPWEYTKGIEALEIVTKQELIKRNRQKSVIALSDNYVASMICYHHPELKEEVKNHPELIELKRQEIQLNRAIRLKEHERKQQHGNF